MEPRRRYYLSNLIEDYLAALQRRGRGTKGTADDYRRELWRMLQGLDVANLATTPAKIGEDEIDYIMTEMYGDLKPKTVQWEVAIFSGWLQYHKNQVVSRMMIAWPTDNRINVDWLSLDELVVLLDAAKGTSRPMVHCASRLFMRRVEIKRLTMKDVYQGVLDVRGKGHGKGKWRTLAFAPETYQVFAEWMGVRDAMIEEAQQFDQGVIVPEEFFIYRRQGHLYPYGDTGIDNRFHEAGEQANLARIVSGHRLRRSGARIAIQADPNNMQTLVEALGHVSETQTRKYCGLTVDDMSLMHQSVSDLLETARERMRISGARPMPPAMRMIR